MNSFTDYLVTNGLLIYFIILMAAMLLFLGLSMFDLLKKTKGYEKDEGLHHKTTEKENSHKCN